jgi:hypothetical protein
MLKLNKTLILQISAVILLAALFLFKNNFFIHYSSYDALQGGLIANSSRPFLDSLNQEIKAEEIKLDSLKKAKEFQVTGFRSYSGLGNDILGIYTLQRSFDEAKPDEQKYLYLGSIGLQINPDPYAKHYLEYFYNGGQAYFQKLKYEGGKGIHQKRFFYMEKAPFRYSVSTNAILIPVKVGFWAQVLPPLLLIVIIAYCAALLFILVNFFIFLIDISRNVVFDQVNINRLRDIVIYGMILSVSPVVLHHIIYWIAGYNYGFDHIMLTYNFWAFDFYIMIFSIVLFLFYTAFSAGLKIKHENDLTV